MEIGFHRFASGKKYAFVKKDDAPIFLRNIIFIQNQNNPSQIAIVREWGGTNTHTWEPPKGQMEWKEFDDASLKPNTTVPPSKLFQVMKIGMLRELGEEAKILPRDLKNLKRLEKVYVQDWPESGIKKAKFVYQFWQANIRSEAMLEAQARMEFLCTHPDLAAMLPKDMCEKDAVGWWSPAEGWTKIRGGFSKKMTELYYG